MGVKGHHGLHLQYGGVGQSMIHAVLGSVIKDNTHLLFSGTQLYPGGGGATDIKRHIGPDKTRALSVVLTEMMIR